MISPTEGYVRVSGMPETMGWLGSAVARSFSILLSKRQGLQNRRDGIPTLTPGKLQIQRSAGFPSMYVRGLYRYIRRAHLKFRATPSGSERLRASDAGFCGPHEIQSVKIPKLPVYQMRSYTLPPSYAAANCARVCLEKATWKTTTEQ